ncbi:MORN repeat-containing protein [Paenibacillus sp. GYB003]|uniref:MORN repeat-containing protein n=1 Tax=Paenibacillus sp. GYB003 TaxID=2994392 RepID=UPI002F961F99
MNRSQFRFLAGRCPELYALAARAEHVFAVSPAAAPGELKAVGRWLALEMMRREGRLGEGEEPADPVADLDAMELLMPAFVALLRRLELADPRESELLVDVSGVKRTMLGLYDLVCWYYKTYIDDDFRPEPYYIAAPDSAARAPAVRGNGMNEAEEAGSRTIVFVDGTEREAEWRESAGAAGAAKGMTDERGGVYRGETKGPWKHGRGTYVWADGTTYEGTWVNDLEHGSGEKRYANGDSYSGEWREGTFHGNGVYVWADGTRYEGGWDGGLEHGSGSKTYPDGTRQSGIWSYGEFVRTTDQLHPPTIQPD